MKLKDIFTMIKIAACAVPISLIDMEDKARKKASEAPGSVATQDIKEIQLKFERNIYQKPKPYPRPIKKQQYPHS